MLKFKSGMTISGIWKQDTPTMGQMDLPYGKYCGGFNDDLQPHGEGILTYKTGDQYSGRFVDGKQHGKAIFKTKTTIFEGTYANGKREEGTEKVLNSEEVFVGTFKDNKRDCGALKFANGDYFYGEFQNNHMLLGIFKQKARGESYKGEFNEKGQYHGSGAIVYQNGDEYQGEFQDGLKHGDGEYTFKEGGSYSGEYFGDEMHGRGRFLMDDGNEYIGEFHKGQQHGDGMLITKQGMQVIGKWESGQFKTLTFKGPMKEEDIQTKDALEAALQLSDKDSSQGSSEKPLNEEEIALLRQAIKEMEAQMSDDE